MQSLGSLSSTGLANRPHHGSLQAPVKAFCPSRSVHYHRQGLQANSRHALRVQPSRPHQFTSASKASPVTCHAASISSMDLATAVSTVQSEVLQDVRVVCYSAPQYVRDFLGEPMRSLVGKADFVEATLNVETARLAAGADVVCCFVNDDLQDQVLEILAECGVKLIAMRCAGYDRVDLAACDRLGIRVVRVPRYSPESVAEHAVALMFALNRNLHSSYARVMQGNYTLSGLVGFEMSYKTAGVVGTGAIGTEACRILKGIGCKVMAYDVAPNPAVQAMGIPYLPLDELLPQCDIVSLHVPLLPSTARLINRETLSEMKRGVMLINVSRGGLIDSDALFDALESGQIGSLGLDVYENEHSLFFVDYTKYSSSERMKKWDRRFKALLAYPQVIVTPHSAFLTKEALQNICDTTLGNIRDWALHQPLENEVKYTPRK